MTIIINETACLGQVGKVILAVDVCRRRLGVMIE